MIVPFRLRRLDDAHPATGLFLPGCDAGPVVAAVAAMGTPLPEIFALADGFLLRRREPIAGHPPGSLRLREAAPHLFLPVDAELVPALLDDEARGLTRDRGLVFLPGETVLAYDRHAPTRLAELVSVGPVRRDAWRPIPAGSRLPERIRAFFDDRPTPPVQTVLLEAAGDAAEQVASEEPPRPPAASSTGQAITGRVQQGLGNFFLWLGRVLGWQWLARQGANLLRGAMRSIPRLTESILGRQQAALRELLREFREGDREAALRRALPLGGGQHRGATTDTGDTLPTHDLRFDLNSLLGSTSRPARLWVSEEEVARQLAEEYRRAAREAAAAGDYRRAAFIHGKLLGDLRLAADLLARGGLHREAALLYLDGVGDELSAARCFEAAGDLDRALALYRKHGRHVEAGDVLRRAGDDEAAFAEYALAADELAKRGRPHEAGDLFRDHVQRPDLAAPYYERGWAQRPAPAATHCVLRLLDLHALTNDRRALLALARAAAEFYETDGAESEAVQVFNALVRLGEQTLPADEREELRDRSLVALARRLRQHAATDQRAANTVALLFGRDGVWGPNVVADAEVAFRTELRTQKTTPASVPHTIVPLGQGPATAVAGSAGGEALFLGFDSGDVVRFVPATGAIEGVRRQRTGGPIDSLGTDATGSHLMLLAGSVLEGCYKGRGYPAESKRVTIRPDQDARPVRVSNCIYDGLFVVWGPTRLEWAPAMGREFPAGSPTTALVLVTLPGDPPPLALRFCRGKVEALTFPFEDAPPVAIDSGGHVPPPGDRLFGVEVRPISRDEDQHPAFLVLGIDDEQRVWSSRLAWDGSRLHWEASWHTRTGGYLCAALLDNSSAVGVHPDGLHWLRRDGNALVPVVGTRLPLEDAVFAWCGWEASEVIVVRRRGDLVRVPRPR